MFTVYRRDQSRPEKIANSLSHGFGLLAAMAGSPYLIIKTARHDDATFIFANSLYSATIQFSSPPFIC